MNSGRNIILRPWQEKASYALNHLLNQGPGAILRGECGIGKTYIIGKLLELRGANPVLWVAPAFALPDLATKVSELSLGVEDHIDFMSYNEFRKGNVEAKDYQFYVFDECHTLRKWSAAATRHFSRIASTRPHLSVSATPVLQEELDFIYVLRRAGAFKDMTIPGIKMKYFQAERSYFHGGFDTYDLVRREEFYSEVNKKVYDIKLIDVEEGAPKIVPHIIEVPISCSPFTKLEDETKQSVADGKRKVVGGAKEIKKFVKDTPNCLILTKFHSTAREVVKLFDTGKVPVNLCLRPKQVAKACEKSEAGLLIGPIITTLGLTRSSFDLNSISHVLIIESSYSYFLDVQSVMRCRRLGKTEDVHVSYLSFSNDRGVRKVLNRMHLLQESNRSIHSKFGPSGLSLLKTCPGAYWMDNTSTFIYEGQAWLGKQHHKDVETFVENLELTIPEGNTSGIIQWARELKADGWEVLTELRMEDPSIRHDFFGTADIVARRGGELIVADYKNGNISVNVKNNLQLLSYTLMAENYFGMAFDKIKVVIWQKNVYNEVNVPRKKLESTREELHELSKRVDESKRSPAKYIDETCTNPFCRAKAQHIKKRLEYREKMKQKTKGE